MWLVAGPGCPRAGASLLVREAVAQRVPGFVSACWWLGLGLGMSGSARVPMPTADLLLGGTRFWC